MKAVEPLGPRARPPIVGSHVSTNCPFWVSTESMSPFVALAAQNDARAPVGTGLGSAATKARRVGPPPGGGLASVTRAARRDDQDADRCGPECVGATAE